MPHKSLYELLSVQAWEVYSRPECVQLAPPLTLLMCVCARYQVYTRESLLLKRVSSGNLHKTYFLLYLRWLQVTEIVTYEDLLIYLPLRFLPPPQYNKNELNGAQNIEKLHVKH